MNENTIVLGVKGVVVHNGRILIIKRAEESHVGGGTWESPGGKLEFGEELEEALIREMKEEVGLDVTVEKLLYTSTFFTHPTRQVILLTYLCKCNDAAVVKISFEHSEYRWANGEELRNLLPQNIIDDFDKNEVFKMVD